MGVRLKVKKKKTKFGEFRWRIFRYSDASFPIGRKKWDTAKKFITIQEDEKKKSTRFIKFYGGTKDC